MFSNKMKTKYLRIITGIIFGFITIFFMINTSVIHEFDTKSILISIIALSFSSTTALITTGIAIAYRIYEGGEGLYFGIFSIMVALSVGLVWKKYFFKQFSLKLFWDLYIFGIIVHIFILLSQFAFYFPDNIETFKETFVPVILIYPIVETIIGIYIFKNKKTRDLQKEFEYNQKRYQTIFDNNPIGLFQYNNEGVIQFVNDSFARIMHVDKEDLVDFDMKKLPNKNLVAELKKSLEGESSNYDGFYISYAGNDGFSSANAVDDGGDFWASDDGVYAQTSDTNDEWGFNTPDKIQGSNITTRTINNIGLNTGAEELENGDIVCLTGYVDGSVADSDIPIIKVEKANRNNSAAVIGVVEYKVYEREEADEKDGKIVYTKSFRFAEGNAHRGEYVSITIVGPADVKVNSRENFKKGESLTSGNGLAQKVKTTKINGITIAENVGILGKALEDSNGKDKIKVYVNCK